MLTAVLSCWSLFLGLALLMLGNGLQGTLLGLRASLESFPTGLTGFVMAGYFVGFVAGSLLVPRMVRHVGHVRVFAALASLASAMVLLHALFVFPWIWLALRVVTGLCMAGLYLVTESWINDVATNRTRGQLLSVYMLVMMTGIGFGQLLLNAADPRGFELFVLTSVLISFALVPMLLSAGSAPQFATHVPISIKELYRASPLGLVGGFSTGIAQGSVFGMGAVFASQIGMSIAQVSFFMTAFSLGAVALLWPIGWLSDRVDRRKIIVTVSALSAAFALVAYFAAAHSLNALIVTIAFYGGVSIPLYSLFIAHSNDHLQPGQRVSASATLVLFNGLGAVFGPLLCAFFMSQYGSQAFMAFLAVSHSAITAFGLWRMTRRDSVPLAAQSTYATMAPRGTQLAAGIASITVRDERDRDLARWSQL